MNFVFYAIHDKIQRCPSNQDIMLVPLMHKTQILHVT